MLVCGVINQGTGSAQAAQLHPETWQIFSRRLGYASVLQTALSFGFVCFPRSMLQDKNSEPEAHAAFIKLTEEYEAGGESVRMGSDCACRIPHAQREGRSL